MAEGCRQGWWGWRRAGHGGLPGHVTVNGRAAFATASVEGEALARLRRAMPVGECVVPGWVRGMRVVEGGSFAPLCGAMPV